MAKEWWEESPEEFASGFTEEVQVHHGPVINQNSNEAMAAMYGPAAAHSEYTRWTKICYRDDGGAQKTGMIIWICAADADNFLMYVVEPAPGGFPEFVSTGDIIGLVEV